MQTAPVPAPLRAFAPDLARRVGLILAALAAIVARRFLREPRLVALVVPLWNRLNRTASRFERLMARLAAGTLPAPRRAAARRVRPLPVPRRAGLPTGRGWLVRALGPEAAACASQLEHLLAEPGVAELLAAAPAARRVLGPLRHMLGVGPAPRRQAARHPAPAPCPREPRPLPPRLAWKLALAHPPGLDHAVAWAAPPQRGTPPPLARQA